jgi:hypothetical protein
MTWGADIRVSWLIGVAAVGTGVATVPSGLRLSGVATGFVGLTAVGLAAVGLTVALTVTFVVFFVLLAVAFTDGLNVVCGLVHPHIATTTPARTHNVRNFMAFFIMFHL